jgi:hypothetical protein
LRLMELSTSACRSQQTSGTVTAARIHSPHQRMHSNGCCRPGSQSWSSRTRACLP